MYNLYGKTEFPLFHHIETELKLFRNGKGNFLKRKISTPTSNPQMYPHKFMVANLKLLVDGQGPISWISLSTKFCSAKNFMTHKTSFPTQFELLFLVRKARAEYKSKATHLAPKFRL